MATDSAKGKPVTAKRAKEIAHEVMSMHIKYPAPLGHGGMGKLIAQGKKHPSAR